MSRTTRVTDDLDLILAAWFDGDAHVRAPEALFGSVIERTSRVRPLPTWRLSERWLPVDVAIRLPQARQRLVPILVVLALAVALVDRKSTRLNSSHP